MTTYNINFTDPLKATFSIAPGAYNGPGGTSSNSSLRLYGRGALEWGESVDEDLLRLSENFSGATTPASPINGQLHRQLVLYWHDTVGNDWYVFDVNANMGTGGWTAITVVDSATLPAPTLLNPISVGEYVYNTTNNRLYGYYSMFGQVTAGWLERAYHESAGAPVDGTDFPQQRLFIFNGYSDKTTERDGWEPVNIVHMSALAPTVSSSGVLWYDGSSLQLYNGTTWEAIGGYTAYNNYDMQGIYNITNMPNQCTGSPLGSNLSPNEAASVGFVQCYIADVLNVGSYLPLAGGTMSGAIDMSGNTILLSADPVNDNDAVNKKYVDDKVASLGYLPVGAIITLPYDGIVPGYLKCDGSSFDKATYPDLFDRLVANKLSDFPLVGTEVPTPKNVQTAASGLVTCSAHGLSQNARIRFNNAAAPIDNTIDYYVDWVSPNTFYLTTRPDGPIAPTGVQSNLHYRQSLYGYGNTAAGALGVDANITHGNLPEMRATFVRGWEDTTVNPSANSSNRSLYDLCMNNTQTSVMFKRQLGTTQKPSIYLGDKNNNTVNNLSRVGEQKFQGGFDYIDSGDYHWYDAGVRKPVDGRYVDYNYGEGSSDVDNARTGGIRPGNISMVYYIKAYDTDNNTQAQVDISALENRVTNIENNNAVQMFSIKQVLASQTYSTDTATYTFPHSLGDYPSLVRVYAENISDAGGGFTAGDRVELSTYRFVDAGSNRAVSIIYNTTSIVVAIRNGIRIIGKNGDTVTLAPGKWNLCVDVYGEV